MRRQFLLILGTAALIAGSPGQALVNAAKSQIGVTLRYDAGYQRIPYPGGDVPLDRGVCTDVVIRAYRRQGADLQVLVHEDMVKAWAAYPNPWGLKGTDRNIDHRRVPNLATFFRRHGQSLPATRDPSSYQPGDIVTWRLPGGLPHIGLISSERNRSGVPLIIHNIGQGTRLEDGLFEYTITGHYRYQP